MALNKPIVGMRRPERKRYWLVASDGGVFSYGDAAFKGSAGALTLNKPIVGMAATPDGKGYWMVASDGGVFDYGERRLLRLDRRLSLNKPIVGIAATHRTARATGWSPLTVASSTTATLPSTVRRADFR